MTELCSVDFATISWAAFWMFLHDFPDGQHQSEVYSICPGLLQAWMIVKQEKGNTGKILKLAPASVFSFFNLLLFLFGTAQTALKSWGNPLPLL